MRNEHLTLLGANLRSAAFIMTAKPISPEGDRRQKGHRGRHYARVHRIICAGLSGRSRRGSGSSIPGRLERRACISTVPEHRAGIAKRARLASGRVSQAHVSGYVIRGSTVGTRKVARPPRSRPCRMRPRLARARSAGFIHPLRTIFLGRCATIKLAHYQRLS
jgi:hypothetical protein